MFEKFLKMHLFLRIEKMVVKFKIMEAHTYIFFLKNNKGCHSTKSLALES